MVVSASVEEHNEEAESSKGRETQAAVVAVRTSALRPVRLALTVEAPLPTWCMVTAHCGRTHRKVEMVPGRKAWLTLPQVPLSIDHALPAADQSTACNSARVEVFQRLGEAFFELDQARGGLLDVALRRETADEDARAVCSNKGPVLVRFQMRTMENEKTDFVRKAVCKRAADKQETLKEYVASTGIKDHMREAAVALMREMPEDPYLFLAQFLGTECRLKDDVLGKRHQASEPAASPSMTAWPLRPPCTQAGCGGYFAEGDVLSSQVRERVVTEPHWVPLRDAGAHDAIQPGSTISSPRDSPRGHGHE